MASKSNARLDGCGYHRLTELKHPGNLSGLRGIASEGIAIAFIRFLALRHGGHANVPDARDPLKSAHLMWTMDPINQRLGSGVVRPGVSADQRKWVAEAEFLLSRYTTRLEES